MTVGKLTSIIRLTETYADLEMYLDGLGDMLTGGYRCSSFGE
jgi:hypothetical protein